MNTPTTQRETVDLHRLVRRFCVLADIPNQEGFRFIGQDHDGELFPCIVRKDPVGCHGAYDERDGSPCFMRMAAWSEYSANTKS